MLAQEAVVAHDFQTRLGVFKVGVESHWRAAVGRQLGNGNTDAGAFIFAERERLVVESAADVARLQCGFAKHSGRQVGEVRRITGAIPEVILVAPPQLPRQQAALIAVDLIEVAQMVPLRHDQVRFERATELHEHFIERSFVHDLGEAQHLAP